MDPTRSRFPTEGERTWLPEDELGTDQTEEVALDDEVALGPATAREHEIDVGDTVSIAGPSEPFDATVTGILVFPTIGPMFAGTVGGGDGILVPQAMIDAVAPFEGAATSLATFVGVDLVDDADPAAIARYGALDDEHGHRIEIESLRVMPKALIARVKGVTTREGAEALTLTKLYIERARLPEREEDEWYHLDLIGLAAVARDGVEIGSVVAVHNFGAGDLIEVQLAAGGATVLVP